MTRRRVYLYDSVLRIRNLWNKVDKSFPFILIMEEVDFMLDERKKNCPWKKTKNWEIKKDKR